MRLAWLAAVGLVLAATPARATPSLAPCQSSVDTVDQAQLIVVAKAKSVETGTKDGRYAMRVTYTVDQVLAGAKTAEVVVETTCNPAPIKPGDDFADRAGRCSAAGRWLGNALPGLTEDGRVGTAPAVLVLGDTTSVLDGKRVFARLRGNWWDTCPEDAATLSKRPNLKVVFDKGRVTNEKTTWGFVIPPAPPPEAAPRPSASPSPPPSPPSPPPPPEKKSGCTMSVGDATSAWPLIGLVVMSLRRRRVARDGRHLA